MSQNNREAIAARLEKLQAANNGILTPQAVVDDAKNPKSPLHGEFEWDVKKAAEAHWLDRAREIIRSVRVVITTEHKQVSVVGYVRDPYAESDQQGYVSVKKLSADADGSRMAAVYEFARASAAMRRAREVAAALGVDKEVDLIVEKIENVKSRVQSESAEQRQTV